MVQLAINDDFLRYDRTFLIYTEDIQQTSEEREIQRKLGLVRRGIVEMLGRNPSGVPLAQVPSYLKRILQFPLDLTELGFPKLKDLLNSIVEVSIELRAGNHPFAVVNKPPSLLSYESLLDIIQRELTLSHFGLLIEQLEAAIERHFTRKID